MPTIYCFYKRENHLFSALYFLVYAEPVSKHIEEQGLEFLQFAFRWFNCLLIREVCLVTLDLIFHMHIKNANLSHILVDTFPSCYAPVGYISC